MSLPYTVLDVFTDVPLQGNQLAVFTDASNLSNQQMQALAKEMNLSETTFIIPRDEQTERERGVRVRIFTVAEELPFAGHPTLGTAAVLRELRGGSTGEIVLELTAGRIPVRFSDRGGRAFGEMRQRDPEFGETYSREQIATATGLRASDIDDRWPVQYVSTGNPFIIVPVRSLKSLQEFQFEWVKAQRFLSATPAKFFYFVTTETTRPEAALHARMIFYGGEDPATGSAAGPAIAWAVKHGVIASNRQAMIEQGVEMGRRSHLYVSAEKQGDSVVNVRAGGHWVVIARGEVFL